MESWDKGLPCFQEDSFVVINVYTFGPNDIVICNAGKGSIPGVARTHYRVSVGLCTWDYSFTMVLWVFM